MKRSEKKKVVSKRDSQDRRKHKKKPRETKPASEQEKRSSESEEKDWDSDWFKFLKTYIPEENQTDFQGSRGASVFS